MNLHNLGQGPSSIFSQTNCGMHDFKYQVPKVANRAECLDETCVERYELLASRWLWRRGLLNISCSFGAALRTYFLPLLAWTSPVIEHVRVHKIVICSRLPWTLDTRWIWTVDETDEYIHDQLRFDFFPHLKGTFLQPFLPLFNWAAIDVSALLILLMLLVSGSVKGLKQWLNKTSSDLDASISCFVARNKVLYMIADDLD